MKPRIVRQLFALILCLASATAQVAVTLRVVDQHGVEIAGSKVSVSGVVNFAATGATVAIPLGSHTVDVYPGIFGVAQSGFGRTLTPIHVTASTSTLTFEWVTQQVAIRVVDQHGVQIAGSGLRFSYPNYFAPTGSTVTLPITDDSVYPTIAGSGAAGYDLDVQPGVFGISQSAFVYSVFDNEVSTATGTLQFEWITREVLVRVSDQYGAEIPNSGLRFAYPNRYFPTGTVAVLPITDESVYPTLAGAGAAGYDLDVIPGVAGVAQSNLVRTEFDNEVLLGSSTMEFQWHVIPCAMTLLASSGVPVPGSSFISPFGTFPSGTLRGLPITENSVYPTIAGSWANGYPITVVPGDLAPPTTRALQFEVLASGALSPDSFLVGGNVYSVVCMSNRAPTVDAGENLSILGAQQITTVLSAYAADPDLNLLQFRWLEGPNELQGPRAVIDGRADLDLGTLPYLGLGEHVLTLEVGDGMAITTDSLILTIGNSPPTAACNGAGTYQAGTDSVVLSASVSDFDGDPLTWEWRSGTVIVASGTASPGAGGSPLALPDTVLATGSGPLAQLGVGAHTLTLHVQDGANPPVECEITVLVVDTEAPRIAPASDQAILWPPDHRMVPVTILANAVDAADGPVFLEASVTSSEDPRKDGSGNTIPDIVGPWIDQATQTIVVQLRAERAGKGRGRTYTVTITATDASLNRSSAEVRIEAPHDRR
ncbi:MAG: hypothetical protein IT457_06775 [Planctomycetes bacterium]|nr:hypothetical protein [Planctomycetota bacterium]